MTTIAVVTYDGIASESSRTDVFGRFIVYDYVHGFYFHILRDGRLDYVCDKSGKTAQINRKKFSAKIFKEQKGKRWEI